MRQHSIIYPLEFDKYFDCSIKGKLNQKEYDSALLNGKKSFLQFIERIADTGFRDDLKEYLENERPTNKEVFETLVNGIFYYNDLDIIKSVEDQRIISTKKFIEILGGSYLSSSDNDKVHLYPNRDAYKNFLLLQLNKSSDIESDSYRFQLFNQMARDYFNMGDDYLTITRSQFRSWYYNRLTNFLKNSENIDLKILKSFQIAVDFYWNYSLQMYIDLCQTDKELDEIITLIKLRLNKENFLLFLFGNLVKCGSDEVNSEGFKIHMAIQIVFPDIEELKKRIIEVELQNEIITEFLEFYKLSTDPSGGPCITHFQFKHIEPDPSKREAGSSLYGI